MSANTAGRVFEDVLAGALTSIGIVFTRQANIGRSIFDTELRVDFLLHSFADFPDGLALECKWQDVGGSIDEKFPYLVMNIKRRYPMPAIMIVDGGGCRAGALAYLQGECDDDHLLAVYSVGEFLSWAMRAKKVAMPEYP